VQGGEEEAREITLFREKDSEPRVWGKRREGQEVVIENLPTWKNRGSITLQRKTANRSGGDDRSQRREKGVVQENCSFARGAALSLCEKKEKRGGQTIDSGHGRGELLKRF